MPKEATPSRYVVDRTGVPDPAHTEYYVLDVTNDPDAREAMAYLGRKYEQHGKHQLSQECFALLDSTSPVFARVMEARNPKAKKATKKEVGRD